MTLLRFVMLLTLAVLLATGPADAQTPRSPPVFDQLASPFTESEIGGFGCLAATVISGVAIVGLIGGPGAIRLALDGIVMSPRTVLEASAATAFVFSSACYVGQALAPVATLGLTTLADGQK